MTTNRPKEIFGRPEKVYCLFIFLLLVAYNIYLDVGDINPNGNDGDFTFWWLLFFLTYLISGVLITVRVIGRFAHKLPFRPITCHLIYVALITSTVLWHWEVDYAKRYVQSWVLYARSGGACEREAQRRKDVAVCYVFASYPRVDVVLIDPLREVSKFRDQWRVSTLRYFEERSFPLNSLVNCSLRADHLYGDVFYLRARCE